MGFDRPGTGRSDPFHPGLYQPGLPGQTGNHAFAHRDVNQETGTPDPEQNLTQTAEVEALPPTPEEIGYTDGIIFMSTLLILILLLGTLREALWRKRS